MATVIIIGAGLTGLSAAYHLEQNGFFDYVLVEKEDTFGGLCRSIEQDGFTFDFTGHLLHINDDYFRRFIDTIFGIHQLNTVTRRSFIYSHDCYTRYPFQINLHGLPPDIIAECIEGYVTRNVQKKHDSYYDWVLSTFGTGFGKHFFFPYQEKIFAYDIHKLSASWTQRFVPSTSLKQIIHGALTDTDDTAIGYNAQFFYPKTGGIVSWVKAIANKLQNNIQKNYCVQNIDLNDNIVKFTNGHTEKYQVIINTMPLDRLLNCLDEKPTTNFASAKKYLVCNSVVNFNLGVAKKNLSDKHWIYFPETIYPFYRIGFPHNFTPTSAPPGCSSLYGEFAYINKTEQWVSDTLAHAIKKTKKLLAIHDDEIITKRIIPISHAYVIYDTWRDHNLEKLLLRLNEQNIYSTGRYGAWKYSSMQEAVLDGKKVIENIMPFVGLRKAVAKRLQI